MVRPNRDLAQCPTSRDNSPANLAGHRDPLSVWPRRKDLFVISSDTSDDVFDIYASLRSDIGPLFEREGQNSRSSRKGTAVASSGRAARQ